MDELLTEEQYNNLNWKHIKPRELNGIVAGLTVITLDPIYTDFQPKTIDGVDLYFREEDGGILVVNISINWKEEDELDITLARVTTSGKE